MAETQDLIRYDLLAQDALRGVVREALRRAARGGLPGAHHFFIALDTRHPGVEMSDRLRGKYPEEITIVLQHQFWNLNVEESRFSVDLSFDNVPERLVVPFTAVKGFFDPSVQFGLQFETAAVSSEEPAADLAAESEEKIAAPLSTPAPAEAKVVSIDKFRKK